MCVAPKILTALICEIQKLKSLQHDYFSIINSFLNSFGTFIHTFKLS